MLTAISAIIIFCILIFPHELGHFIAARKCGVLVNELALGMGPAIWKKQGKETLYSLRAIPIGGYNKMEGEDEASDNPRAFVNQGFWGKLVILISGSLVNMLIAFILMIIITAVAGTPTTTIEEITPDSPAQEVGIMAGDKIISIDGKDVDSWNDVGTIVSGNEGEEIAVVVDRSGQEITFKLTPKKNEDGSLIIGVVSHVEHNVGSAIPQGIKASFGLVAEMYRILGQLFTGGVSVNDMSGPVGIVYAVNQSTHMGFIYLVYLTALMSMNLAVINMLPLPALDGGRILMLIIRKISPREISDDLEGKIHLIGMVLLLMFMIYITFQDVIKFIIPSFS